jgi:hypothetical protein
MDVPLPFFPGKVVLEGVVIAHKQTIRDKVTLVRVRTDGQPLEFPDLRDSVKPGDVVRIEVTVIGTAEKVLATKAMKAGQSS